ncbi:MAG TPA: 2-oxoacid:ferredoxin oxidoreductase subunit beta [Verrucomicrobiae bacterium]|jgi:2-oxoglutarate ferredoxin oxidoreductase subunit beta|nr:2-oxoacid:ferredoxin oxidoreductase subunit beta [Verrucomicrobiae bacterium]
MSTPNPVPPSNTQNLPFTKDDFVSGQEVRWCPGCGDYAILAVMQRTLSKFAIPRENYVFVSGIGCSSRFPYYMNTYGFHSIHGRAPTIASGLRCVNPNLVIWLITGDGDALSIGGNHFLHILRRNLNVNIVLVNNRIYGLTKGQYSPTSEAGKITKSSPQGAIDYPVNPLSIALASEATFIARSVDSDPKHMEYVFERAMQHKGTSLVEVYQNCNIFNDKAFYPVTGRENRDDRAVYLEHDKPLIFGKKRDLAIRVKGGPSGLKPEIVDISKNKDADDLLIHNEKEPDPSYAYMLTQFQYPGLPVPLGVFRAVSRPTYDEMLDIQTEDLIKKKGKGDIKNLLYGNDTWTVN